MVAKNPGKVFEESFETSAKSLNLFFLRIKDTHIPSELRKRVPVTKNKFDCLLFDGQRLFTLELKSTGNKSVSFDERIIKQHQIDNLVEANTYENVCAGFIFNFREYENKTYFVPIDQFCRYKLIAQSEFAVHNIQSKINKSSISLDVCAELGTEIPNYKKRTKYHYHIKEFINEVKKDKQ